MIRICLDTNAFHENWLAAGEAFTFIADLIAKQEGRAYVSEITILEHMRQYQKQASAIQSGLKSSLAKYGKLFSGEVPSLPALTNAAGFDKAFRKRIKELGIEILDVPEVPQAVLVKRDLAEKKPFTLAGKGYRDALIWLGFLAVLESDTSTAVLVTSDANDYCGDDETTLHPDLIEEVREKNSQCAVLRFASPQKLVDDLIKPVLKVHADEEAKTQRLLMKIQSNDYKFKIEDVVGEGLDNLGSHEIHGAFYAGDAALDEPLWLSSLHDPEDIEAIGLYKLSSGRYICEGTAEARATIEGFLDKFEAFDQSVQGNVFITNENWNEHYSEVEVSNVPCVITFSFGFKTNSSEVEKFEVTKIESKR